MKFDLFDILPVSRPGESCLMFRVEERPGVGRCCVAASDLQPGDLVMEDTAVMVAPGGGERLCLECGQQTEERCDHCGLAVCCEGGQHQVECQYKFSFPSNTVTHLGVAVVRLLHLEQSWQREEVSKLMDHLEGRRCDPDWEMMETVADCLQAGLAGSYSRAEILRTAGIVLTNTASCNSLAGGEDKCIGLFPVFSLLSHSCVANTRRETDRGRMRVIATVHIKEGEQIVTSYKNPLLGSVSRRCHFPRVWYFDCECARCQDPSELGSHLSTLVCEGCGELLLPSHPLHHNSPWSCSSCSLSISSHQAMARCVRMYRALLSCPPSHQHLATLLAGLQTVAHPQHYVLLQAKMKFVMLASSEPDVLAMQTSLCQEILSVLDLVEPGLTRRRGEILRVSTAASPASLLSKCL